MTTLAEVRARSLRALIPPPRVALSAWVEREIVLPVGVSALPGRVKLWPWQRAILDAIGSAEYERVSIVKCVRVGLSTMFAAAIGHYLTNDPSPVLLLLPTESDARDVVVSDLEPIFGSSPALCNVLSADPEEGEQRNTLTHRRAPGGASLRVVAAKAPRNLRRHRAHFDCGRSGRNGVRPRGRSATVS